MSEANAMSKRFVMLTLIVILGKLSCFGQQQTAFADTALYNAVVDELFRTDIGDFRDQTKATEIVLRFSLSSTRELQIAITERKSQASSYKLWFAPMDQPSIWDQVSEVSSRLHTDDPKKIAAAVHVEQQVLDHPSARLKKLAKGFSELKFSPAFNRGLIIDGTRYDLWFDSPSNSTHFSLDGSPRGQPSDHPLILWMIAMRSEIHK